MSSLFCRHNRFTAECPICSKNSVLAGEPAERRASAKPKPAAGRKRGPRGTAQAPARTYVGPHVATEPLEREARIYEVRLEKVLGGLRLAEWRAGSLEHHAPVLPASALRELVAEAAGRGLIGFSLPDADPARVPEPSAIAASSGVAGDMREELRVERAQEPGMVRVGRYIYWPGDDRWELQHSPLLLPERRFEEALTKAARGGLV
jgi:hypothetical protein